jgi:hypothetical protein
LEASFAFGEDAEPFVLIEAPAALRLRQEIAESVFHLNGYGIPAGRAAA